MTHVTIAWQAPYPSCLHQGYLFVSVAFRDAPEGLCAAGLSVLVAHQGRRVSRLIWRKTSHVASISNAYKIMASRLTHQ